MSGRGITEQREMFGRETGLHYRLRVAKRVEAIIVNGDVRQYCADCGNWFPIEFRVKGDVIINYKKCKNCR